MPELTSLSVSEIGQGLAARTFRASELVEAHLGAIKQRNDELGAFLYVDQDGARTAANELDAAQSRSERLPHLAGVVVAVKDNICVQGWPTTAASRILEGYQPPYSATVVERLRHAGAILIGKTNLDEFAMGASTEHSAYQQTRNPHDPERVPGGSSGGSAAAVAANLATVALGSDTGGSVRQPAAFCGVVGFRPTYGTVSRRGLIAMASSLDVIGPIARNVADARELYAAMAGYDPGDATTLEHFQIGPGGGKIDGTKIRIGIPKEYLSGAIHPDVTSVFNRARAALVNAGAEMVEVSLPSTAAAVPAYYVITPAEASSNLGRYDGIRFGPAAHAHLGHGAATAALRNERFGPEPKRRLLLGSYVLSAGFADRYYHAAQRVRTLIRQDFTTAFTTVDVLLTPTTPTPAFPLGEIADPVGMYRQDIFVAAASLAGLPAISLPVPGAGLPIGVQLIGSQGSDSQVLDIAAYLETLLEKSA